MKENQKTTIESSEIRKMFNAFCGELFNDWKVANEWEVQLSDSSWCDRDTKTIFIKPSDDVPLDVLIIHEISHATTTDDHGDQWYAELRRVAETAAAKNDQDLAERLLKHIDWVRDGYDVNMEDEVYNAVHSYPDSSCDEVLEIVAREYEQTVQFLEATYPQCRKWYQESREVYEEHQKLDRQKKERFAKQRQKKQ